MDSFQGSVPIQKFHLVQVAVQKSRLFYTCESNISPWKTSYQGRADSFREGISTLTQKKVRCI